MQAVEVSKNILPPNGISRRRPEMIHGDTDNILSYYENHAAAGSAESGIEDERRPFPSRRISITSRSSSSSEYSDNASPSLTHNHGIIEKRKYEIKGSGRVERVPSTSRPGGSDRRRIAVVETDLSSSTSIHHRGALTKNSDTEASIGTRRGTDRVSRLTLVAPPDASPVNYRHDLTPPSSAPAHTTRTPSHTRDTSHQRSASEAVGEERWVRRKQSRDIGIVGTDMKQSKLSHHGVNHSYPQFEIKESNAPVFQRPSKSPSSTPVLVSSSSPPMTAINVPLTPQIGQEKDITTPVVGPVVIDATRDWRALSSSSSFSSSFSSNPSSYLHYQPGIHSTAGPPPPPISRVGTSGPPPPRPPRLHATQDSNTTRTTDLQGSKDSLRLPNPAPTASLARSSSSSSTRTSNVAQKQVDDDAITDKPVTLRHSRSMHTREGAFPPSQTEPTSSPELSTLSGSIISSGSSQDTRFSPSLDERPLPPIAGNSKDPISQDKLTESIAELRKESSWVSLKAAITNNNDSSPDDGPPSPAKESAVFLNPALTNQKRFSALPRTPSYTSTSLRTARANVSRSPSPSLPPIPVRRKIISPWPSAMQYADVLDTQSSLGRGVGYAGKINELAMYDCGLERWVITIKHRGNTRRPTSNTPSFNATPNVPSTFVEQPQVRQTSHGSMGSETTFPTRADAYAATDLSPRPEEDVQKVALQLPYPSLALAPRNNSRSPPSTILNLPLPLPAGKSGRFFSSLGRKTSKKDRLTPNQTYSGKLLTKASPNPKPISLVAAPVVPGGPRAPPKRVHSVMAAPSRSSGEELSAKSMQQKKRSSMVRRPSLFTSSKASESAHAFRNSAEFNDQLENLIVLLPHADRHTLAGYLRRAGQDILAVGRYLEDEKNGTIIRH